MLIKTGSTGFGTLLVWGAVLGRIQSFLAKTLIDSKLRVSIRVNKAVNSVLGGLDLPPFLEKFTD